MALANVLQPNSYSIIDNITYSKEGRQFSCNLVVYSNSQKQHKIVDLYFHVNGNISVEEIQAVNVLTFPDDILPYQKFIFSKDAVGEFAEYANKTVYWDGSYRDVDGVRIKHIEKSSSENNIVWVIDRNCYCKVQEGFPQVNHVSQREFDQFFNVQTVLQLGILGCSYAYVKSMPLASVAVDC